MSPDDAQHEPKTTSFRGQDSDYPEEIGKKEQRKLQARRHPGRSIWFGLGLFGVIGWSIAVPTLIGIAVGAWLDRVWSASFSWTLMCLFVGVVTGCVIAWYWIRRESGQN